jgi:hypothetical protein
LRRLYLTFPGGLPGAGLLLLRAAIGVRFLIEAFSFAFPLQNPSPANVIAALLTSIIGFAFVLGVFTAAVGALAALAATVLHFWPAPAANVLLVTSLSNTYVIAIAAALALLGPGAVSLDAHFFGRRKIVIPRSLS